MKEIHGLRYSKEEFDGYKFRAVVALVTIEDEFRLDVYTTDTNRGNFQKVLLTTVDNKVVALRVDHWASKETDDAIGNLIDEWLEDEK